MPGTPDASAGYVERLKRNLERSDSHPSAVSGELLEWLRDDRAGLLGAVVMFVREGAPPESLRFLADFLLGHDLFPFCDPGLASLRDEVEIARRLAAGDPFLDTKLARRLAPWGASAVAARNERILALLAEISDGSRVLPMLVQTLQDANPRLRSKAALLVGRCRRSTAWLENRNSDPDARVRANGIEGLWGAQARGAGAARARPVLQAAARDPDNRVAGNALLGLYLMGEAESIPRIVEMAANPDRRFRSSAVWIMGQTGDSRFLPVLKGMTDACDRALRFQALRAMAIIRRTTAQRCGKGALTVRATAAAPGLLRVEVGGRDGMPELPATCFTVYEGSQPVPVFTVSVRACGGKGSTARGVALEYCYEIQYAPGPGEVRVTVCCEQGGGEARV